MSLEKCLQSEVNIKIIKFFLENPSCIDNSRGISTWINVNIEKTERALKKLVEASILIPHGEARTLAYSYTNDKKLLSRIKVSLNKIDLKRKKKYH